MSDKQIGEVYEVVSSGSAFQGEEMFSLTKGAIIEVTKLADPGDYGQRVTFKVISGLEDGYLDIAGREIQITHFSNVVLKKL